MGDAERETVTPAMWKSLNLSIHQHMLRTCKPISVVPCGLRMHEGESSLILREFTIFRRERDGFKGQMQ